MAIDTVTPRSRRVLLAATAGSLAALAAQALGRPLPARAADGDPMIVGDYHAATATTTIENTSTVVASAGFSGYATGASGTTYGLRGQSDSTSGIGVVGLASAASGTTYGVHGQSNSATGIGVKGLASAASGTGVRGEASSGHGVQGISTSGWGVSGSSTSGWGVLGISTSGWGVLGTSTSGWGVLGTSDATDRAALAGYSNGSSTAVYGFSGSGFYPAAPAKTGVYGYAAQDSSARGVTGRTTAGRGVNGVATSGRGVNGYAGTGIGVYAAAGSGGTAFHAEGRVTFKTAGLATIGSGTASKTVTPGLDLTSASKILCTLMGNAGGATTVKRVAVNTTTNAFTIYLTAAATSAVKVAWFVIG